MEKKHCGNKHPSLGIFIFYQEPEATYWNAVQSFFSFSMGIKPKQLCKYSIMDYKPHTGYFDMMTLILDDIHARGIYTFHNLIIYVDNSHLLETDYHKNELWYRLFDNYNVFHLLFIYKDFVEFETELFSFKLSCQRDNLKIEHSYQNSFMKNRLIVLDNLNIEEFCLLILKCSKRTNMVDFLPQWVEVSNEPIVNMRTNFIPTNDTVMFYNYYDTDVDVHPECIFPLCISRMTSKFLETVYRELKLSQKRKILKAIYKS
jgi:hypothetical protein